MLRSLWSTRLPNPRPHGALWWAWSGLALLFVLLAPAQLWDGTFAGSLPARGLTEALAGGAAFIAHTLWLRARSAGTGGLSVAGALAAGIACYGAAYGLLAFFWPDVAYSRGQFAVACGAGLVLALLPHVFAPVLRVSVVAALGGAVGVVLALGLRPAMTGAPARVFLSTALRPIERIAYESPVAPVRKVRGGAIEPLDSSLVVITNDGDFYQVTWPAADAGPDTRRLPLSLPDDSGSANDTSIPLTPDGLGGYRVLDLEIDVATSPATALVSTQIWHPAQRCYTLRVSSAPLATSGPPPADPASVWTTLFETWPCVPTDHRAFHYVESGGRLALFDDKILFTTGDFGLGHVIQPAPSQSAESAYGKVWQLDRSGGHEIFTTGHRNPQGLLVAGGHIWLTEHGPQGGDELNLLEQGQNYGWPLATYGTEYGRYFWPLAPGQRNHGRFVEPVHAFVPSIAVSNLIRVESTAFPEWRGDLLVGSLNRATLFRLRIRDGRVVYLEPIPVRARIRDLAEVAGRIVLWTDGSRLVVLAPGPSEPVGSVVFARCRTCHESPPGPESQGPPLRGIVGAPVARTAGYRYTAALAQLGGRWTEERLDAFLEDPNAFAPGSLMATGQVPDDKERRAVIEFLKSYK